MASIVNDPNGRRRIQFVAPDGSRRTVRLGKCDQKTAQSICRHVEALLATRLTGEPIPRATAVWLEGIGEPLRDRLVRAGLLESDRSRAPKLADFLHDYLQRQTHVKPASLLAVKQAVRNLLDYFTAERRLDTITPGDADDFRKYLLAQGLAPATVGKRISYCSSIFRDACQRKLLTENPFVGIKRPAATNPERQVYVPVEVIERLIEEQAPSAEWRLLLALARYLGVRVPSEPFSMTWDCVDWERNRLRIPSPKTAVHGKSYRVVPLLPQVRRHLEEVFAQAPEGSVYVFHHLRQRESVRMAQRGFWANLNLRQQLLRMLRRAGLQPWPRLWHNLRSSAQTDMSRWLPLHVVCEWLGNTTTVALDHYLQVTEEHYAQALACPLFGAERGDAKSDAKSGAQVTQKAAQQVPAGNGRERKDVSVTSGELPFYADACIIPHSDACLNNRGDRI